MGKPETGLSVLAEAMALAIGTEECYYEAELHRLNGELILYHSGDQTQVTAMSEEAQACFQEAIAVARRQNARWLELRATLGLARLWQQQSKQDAARQRLTEIQGRITEGFDTADWQQSKTLLDPR